MGQFRAFGRQSKHALNYCQICVHTALSMHEFVAKIKMTSLDFTLCDFTILKLKVTVMGSGFNITMMQAKLQDATGHITKFA